MCDGTASQYTRSWVARPLLPISQQNLLSKGYMSVLYLSMRNFRLHEYFVSFTLYSSCAKLHTVGTAKPRCIEREQVRVTTGIGASSFPSPSLEILRYMFFIPSMKKIGLKSFSIV